ncbi:MAG TPA: NAD(P)/FAD-dependent oxidoreductase [Propionibacteriaceae bacterium]|nr:NAD(P)/FAD-dependent oxidoreductase [Propionibacteriaceae bacterium]
MTKSKVVVVGGGFGGLEAVKHLAAAGHPVSLIDRHPYSTFQPLLYQVATGGLNPGDVTYPLRRYVADHRDPDTRFRRATVVGIDKENKIVKVTRGHDISYDYLVLANGVGANFFGIPGAAEHSRSIYTRAAALDVRDIIFSGLEALTASKDRDKRFTVVVVGGGPTGVEMSGTLAEMKTQALSYVYPEIHQDNFRVVLVEMGGVLLAPFDPRLQRYTLRQLTKRGVDVRLNTAITQVDGDRVRFKDGGELDVDVVVWGAGIGGHTVVRDWGVPQGRGGRIEIDRNLRVLGEDSIFAIGDCAICNDDPMPQLAQPAIQMGEHVAKQIVALEGGGEMTPFEYHDKGTMATIGRGAAVLQLPKKPDQPAPRVMTGMIAWTLWVVVHLRSLLGGRNQLEAMLNLGMRYASWPRSATGIIGDITESPAEQSRSIITDDHERLQEQEMH